MIFIYLQSLIVSLLGFEQYCDSQNQVTVFTVFYNNDMKIKQQYITDISILVVVLKSPLNFFTHQHNIHIHSPVTFVSLRHFLWH